MSTTPPSRPNAQYVYRPAAPIAPELISEPPITQAPTLSQFWRSDSRVMPGQRRARWAGALAFWLGLAAAVLLIGGNVLEVRPMAQLALPISTVAVFFGLVAHHRRNRALRRGRRHPVGHGRQRIRAQLARRERLLGWFRAGAALSAGAPRRASCVPRRPPAAPDPTAPAAPRPRPTWPGTLSFFFGLTTVAALVAGITLATSDLYQYATWAAWGGVGTSILSVVLAIVAFVGRYGASWGAAGFVFAVIANPLVLTSALNLIGGWWA